MSLVNTRILEVEVYVGRGLMLAAEGLGGRVGRRREPCLHSGDRGHCSIANQVTLNVLNYEVDMVVICDSCWIRLDWLSTNGWFATTTSATLCPSKMVDPRNQATVY